MKIERVLDSSQDRIRAVRQDIVLLPGTGTGRAFCPSQASRQLRLSGRVGGRSTGGRWSLVDAPGWWFVLRKFSSWGSGSLCSTCLLKQLCY